MRRSRPMSSNSGATGSFDMKDYVGASDVVSVGDAAVGAIRVFINRKWTRIGSCRIVQDSLSQNIVPGRKPQPVEQRKVSKSG
jgi:hypothetical protein